MYSYIIGHGMSDSPNPKDIIGAIFGAILIIVLSAMVSSCKVQSLPQSHENDSIVTKTEYKWDSVYIDRYHTIYQKGDTIYKTDSIFIDRWHKAEKADTIYVDKTQTIVQTERYIPQFYKTCTWIMWAIVVLILLYIAIRILKAVYLRK